MTLIRLLQFIAAHPLTRDRRVDAVIRLARWQIASRLLRGDFVWEWVNGARFFARNGETGLTQNIYTGLQEFSDMAYVLHVMSPEDLFVDIGANVGSYTLLACRAVGARGYAFEPIPATYARLFENIRLNQIENRVTCLNIGIGSAPGTIKFTAGLDTMNHVLADGEIDPSALDVKVVTLDSILANADPALIKIDVEGYEMPVLEGASQTLKKQSLHSVIMELNGSGARYSYQESKIVEMMRDYGFAGYSYEPFGRTLRQMDGKKLDSGNTLFIRNVELVAEKVKAAGHFAVNGKQI
jgi:FkbM family methyltransferase